MNHYPTTAISCPLFNEMGQQGTSSTELAPDDPVVFSILPPAQRTTVWNGDHVTNGGNKQWAEEDQAMHALNMQNWRNKM